MSERSKSDLAAGLAARAEHLYGAARTKEIRGQVEHLAAMLFELSRRELEIRDQGPAEYDAGERRGS